MRPLALVLLDGKLSHRSRYDGDFADYTANRDDDDKFIPRGSPLKLTASGKPVDQKPRKVGATTATAPATKVGKVFPEASNIPQINDFVNYTIHRLRILRKKLRLLKLDR